MSPSFDKRQGSLLSTTKFSSDSGILSVPGYAATQASVENSLRSLATEDARDRVSLFLRRLYVPMNKQREPGRCHAQLRRSAHARAELSNQLRFQLQIHSVHLFPPPCAQKKRTSLKQVPDFATQVT